jgi:hypothetical protein
MINGRHDDRTAYASEEPRMVTRLRRLQTAEGSVAATGQPWQARATSLLRRTAGLVRQHWLISALLAAGLVLRVLAQLAYSPPIIYVDTLKYLYRLYPGSEPLGYRYLLKLILVAGNLDAVALLQHVAGLGMAIALYAVLTRRGAARWLAALATAPVLLDAYQLQMEQMIMPDAWFEAMMVAGLVVLLWRPGAPVRFAAVAGLIFGVAATFKQQGELLILPALCYLLMAPGLRAAGGWRPLLQSGAALTAAFLLPVVGYSSLSLAQNGHFRLAVHQSWTGRFMGAVDCATLNVPPAARALCPTPAEQAMGPDNLEHSIKSPLHQGTMRPAVRGRLIGELNSAVLRQQTGRVAVAIGHDWLRIFTASRAPASWATPVSRWQFQTTYPTAPKWVQVKGGVVIIGLQKLFGPFHYVKLPSGYGGPVRVDRPVASFLRSYQLDGGYTPGWLFGLCAVAGLAGSVLAIWRRGKLGARLAAPAVRDLGSACLAVTVTAAVVLLAPIAVEFSWRYMLPAVVTLPPAGVLGAAAIMAAFRRPAGPGSAEPAA